MTIAEELIGKGLEKGRAQGRAEGRAEALRTLLLEKFGTVDADAEARIASADADALDRYLRHVLRATTLADVFAR